VDSQPWIHTFRGKNLHTCIPFIRGFSHEDLKTRRTTETSQPSQSAALRQTPAEPLPHFPRQASVPNNLCSHRRPYQAVHPRSVPVAYSSPFQDALSKILSSSIQDLSSQTDTCRAPFKTASLDATPPPPRSARENLTCLLETPTPPVGAPKDCRRRLQPSPKIRRLPRQRHRQ
jgi:hypothetical protein